MTKVRGVEQLDVEVKDKSEIEEFETFVRTVEPRLRRALIAAYGSERGREAAAESLAYAWANWSRVRDLEHPVPYLYRVGQSRSRHRRTPAVFTLPNDAEHVFEPGLVPALASLTESQRIAVVLVHGFAWTLQEVAELTGTKKTSVQNHVERGLAKLRRKLDNEK